jgi:hypothetical protein
MVDFQEGLTAVKLLLILVFGHGDLCYHYCCFVGLLYFFVIPLIPSGAEAGFNLKQIILQQILLFFFFFFFFFFFTTKSSLVSIMIQTHYVFYLPIFFSFRSHQYHRKQNTNTKK